MKKYLSLIIVLLILYTPIVFAHEKLDNGWHMVPINNESEINKSWDEQSKEWGYYENGKEIMRYSKLLGAHRAWGEAPENSLAAIKMLREKGYYAFETDIRFTKDNVPVLCHDAAINVLARNNDLSTITNTVNLKDITYNELKNNYIFNIERLNHDGATMLDGFNTNRITTFEEMLNYVKANKMYVSIELKEGTKEQIESLVKMTQEKNMHNYVRWISFYTDLLEYVKNYDSDEYLLVLTSSSCDTNHNLYCGEETEYFYNKLKTSTNMVWITNSSCHPADIIQPNLPASYEGNPPDRFFQAPIPQGMMNTFVKSTIIEAGKEQVLSYEYDGDGIVKCISSDPTQLTCNIDTENQTIQLKSNGNDSSNVNIILYGTQGVGYSATEDLKLQALIKDTKSFVSDQVNNIEVEGYKLNFKNTTYQYKIAIGMEKELKMNVKLDSDDLSYTIEGNENLQNGSVVKVNIMRDNETIVTYNIEVEKNLILQIPNTFKSNSKLFILTSLILIILGSSLIYRATTIKIEG